MVVFPGSFLDGVWTRKTQCKQEEWREDCEFRGTTFTNTIQTTQTVDVFTLLILFLAPNSLPLFVHLFWSVLLLLSDNSSAASNLASSILLFFKNHVFVHQHGLNALSKASCIERGQTHDFANTGQGNSLQNVRRVSHRHTVHVR